MIQKIYMYNKTVKKFEGETLYNNVQAQGIK